MLPCSRLIFPSNLVFWNLFQFLVAEITLKLNISHTLNPNLIKYIPLNPAHHDRSNNTKDKFQFLQNFQLQFNLVFREEIIKYSRTFDRDSKHHGTKPMHPSLSRAFQRHQEQNLKHPSLVDPITTKQNKTKHKTNYLPL